MSEIVCPSCRARYQIPASIIGPEGRNVKCSSCGHRWRAQLEGLSTGETGIEQMALQAGVAAAAQRETARTQGPAPQRPQPVPQQPAPAAPQPAAQGWPAAQAPAPQVQDVNRRDAQSIAPDTATGGGPGDAPVARMTPTPQPQAPMPVPPRGSVSAPTAPAADRPGAAGGDTPPGSARAPGPATDDGASARHALQNERLAQMAEIRAMLDDLHQTRATPQPTDDELDELGADGADGPANYDWDDRAAEPAGSETVEGPTRPQFDKKGAEESRKNMLRGHQRRVRKRKIAEARKPPSAFSTGVMLAVLVAAIMTGVYALSPQIIERMPGTEAAMRNYVATVDGFRGSVAESYASLTDWVSERLEKL